MAKYLSFRMDIDDALRLGLFAALALWVACASIPKGGSIPMPSSDHQVHYPEQWTQKTSFRFLVLGDTQNPKPWRRQNHTERRAIYDRLKEALADTGVAFVVHVGDLVDNGSKNWQWRKYFDELFWDRLAVSQKRRFFPLLGNHDYKSHLFDYGGGDLSLFFERFPHLEGQRYYFFVYGDACFIAMDAGRNGIMKVLGGERWQNGVEEQIEWLREVVFPYIRRRAESGELRRIFVFFHKPGYATPIEVKNEQSVQILRLFDDFNQESGNRHEILAFAGHIHTFSHIVKDYNQDGKGEIDQFTTGGGGGRQVGRKNFKKVRRVEDLDLFRKKKYHGRVREGEFDRALFDELRLDNSLFGYLEVVVGDEVRIIYHRCDEGDFYQDYEFAR